MPGTPFALDDNLWGRRWGEGVEEFAETGPGVFKAVTQAEHGFGDGAGAGAAKADDADTAAAGWGRDGDDGVGGGEGHGFRVVGKDDWCEADGMTGLMGLPPNLMAQRC